MLLSLVGSQALELATEAPDNFACGEGFMGRCALRVLESVDSYL